MRFLDAYSTEMREGLYLREGEGNLDSRILYVSNVDSRKIVCRTLDGEVTLTKISDTKRLIPVSKEHLKRKYKSSGIVFSPEVGRFMSSFP